MTENTALQTAVVSRSGVAHTQPCPVVTRMVAQTGRTEVARQDALKGITDGTYKSCAACTKMEAKTKAPAAKVVAAPVKTVDKSAKKAIAGAVAAINAAEAKPTKKPAAPAAKTVEPKTAPAAKKSAPAEPKTTAKAAEVTVAKSGTADHMFQVFQAAVTAGTMGKGSLSGYRAGVRAVLKTLAGGLATDLATVDVTAAEATFRANSKTLIDQTANTYAADFRRAVAIYRSHLADPTNWTPPARGERIAKVEAPAAPVVAPAPAEGKAQKRTVRAAKPAVTPNNATKVIHVDEVIGAKPARTRKGAKASA